MTDHSIWTAQYWLQAKVTGCHQKVLVV